ncbi:MAG: DUF4382 domain-containing protein, partial [Dehalococcoidia bacterium]|nr:DUF4382 domain-containing protein [Dehalococcoidia bacterium]
NIQVHRSGASENSWITVVKEENTFDLVALQGVEILLGTSELEAGQYTQIRLDVTKVMVTMGNEEIEAKLPGEKLKVVRPWEIKAGETTVLTLDFEADKFVVMTGKGNAQVKPVIKLEVSRGKRPLKTKETKEKPDDKPAPKASPTVATGAETTQQGSPPGIPHTLQGRDNCLLCHGSTGIEPFPSDHAGRTIEICQGCHKAAGQ